MYATAAPPHTPVPAAVVAYDSGPVLLCTRADPHPFGHPGGTIHMVGHDPAGDDRATDLATVMLILRRAEPLLRFPAVHAEHLARRFGLILYEAAPP